MTWIDKWSEVVGGAGADAGSRTTSNAKLTKGLHELHHLNLYCTIDYDTFKRKLLTQGNCYRSSDYNKKPYLQFRIIIIKHNNIVLVLASKPSEIIPAFLTTDNQLHCYLDYNLDLNEIQREDNLCKHWAMFKCNLIIAEYCQVFDCSLVQWR